MKHATPFPSALAIGIASTLTTRNSENVVCSGDNEMVTMTRSWKNWTRSKPGVKQTLRRGMDEIPMSLTLLTPTQKLYAVLLHSKPIVP